MTENKTEFELVFDFGKLYQAYKTSISGKKLNKKNQISVYGSGWYLSN